MNTCMSLCKQRCTECDVQRCMKYTLHENVMVQAVQAINKAAVYTLLPRLLRSLLLGFWKELYAVAAASCVHRAANLMQFVCQHAFQQPCCCVALTTLLCWGLCVQVISKAVFHKLLVRALNTSCWWKLHTLLCRVVAVFPKKAITAKPTMKTNTSFLCGTKISDMCFCRC